MANRFKLIRPGKNDMKTKEEAILNSVFECSGLTVMETRDIMSKSKYKVGDDIYLAEDDGNILEEGKIEETFWDKLDDGNIDYVYNICMMDDDSESHISGIYQSAMNEEGFYSRQEYVQKFNKQPVYVAPSYEDEEDLKGRS